MKAMFAGVVATLSLVILLNANQAGQKEEPKYKIGEVMAKAMKGGLAKKVADGKATEAEKKQLVEYFVALHANTPPKGEKTAWEKVTKSLVEAAKSAEGGDEKAGKSIAKLITCANCHKEFKGK
jgi:hypothetical protein